MKLITINNGKEVMVGQTVRTFRGELCKLTGFAAPSHIGSTGRVYVQFDNTSSQSSFFPAVIGCQIVSI